MDTFTLWFSDNGLILIGMVISAFTITIISIKESIKFDVNQWLNDRRKHKEANLRALCPHCYLCGEAGRSIFVTAYISPLGTVQWQCQLCGNLTYSHQLIKEGLEYWTQSPERFIKRNEQMKKLLKKLRR